MSDVKPKGLKLFIKDLCSYLHKNKKKEFSVGGMYFSENDEKDVLIEFLSTKTNSKVGISGVFEKSKELYGLVDSVVENLIFFIDDCFDEDQTVLGSKIYYKVRNYGND